MSVIISHRKVRGRAGNRTDGSMRAEHEPDQVRPAGYFRWKGSLDRLGAVILLVPGAPLMAFLILLVRLTSRGPGLFRQVRMGKGGHRFTMLKIRTMRLDAESATGAAWSQGDDPRTTWLGKILRKLHLDELPQLWNVIRGEMSLVGPRPERPEFVHVLQRAIPGYRGRLAVTPGITGMAQLNLPPDSDLDSVRRKLVLDLEYVEQATLSMDAGLLFCTFLRIFKIPVSPLLSLFGLARNVELAPGSPDAASGADAPDKAVTTLDQVAAEVQETRPSRETPAGDNGNGRTTSGDNRRSDVIDQPGAA